MKDFNDYNRGLRRLRLRVLSIITLAVMLLPCIARADDIFGNLADDPAVESTYISGRFAHNYQRWNMGGRSLNLSMGFSSLYAYDCTSGKSVAKAKALLESYCKKHPELEVMLRSKQNGSDYIMLEEFGKDKKVYKWVIWDSSSPNQCEIVVINWKDGYLREQDR